MILVALTGGIGAGKSAVSTRLAERGAVIVDADGIVRELQVPGAPLLTELAARFGGRSSSPTARSIGPGWPRSRSRTTSRRRPQRDHAPGRAGRDPPPDRRRGRHRPHRRARHTVDDRNGHEGPRLRRDHRRRHADRGRRGATRRPARHVGRGRAGPDQQADLAARSASPAPTSSSTTVATSPSSMPRRRSGPACGPSRAGSAAVTS